MFIRGVDTNISKVTSWALHSTSMRIPVETEPSTFGMATGTVRGV